MPKVPILVPSLPVLEIGRPDVLLKRAAQAESEGRERDALRLYERVLTIDPTNLVAINHLGVAAGEKGELMVAIQHFQNSLRIDRTQAQMWYNHALALARLGLSENALISFRRNVEFNPDHATGHLEIASTLARLGRWEESRTAYQDALCLLPNDPVTAKQHALSLQWCDKIDEAFMEFDRALALDPHHAKAIVSKAFLLMTLGRLPEGLRLYESRWLMDSDGPPPAGPIRHYNKPLWLGEPDIAGKTIFVHAEQGLGDEIQFCRYATLAARAGAHVIVEARPELVTLMSSLVGVSQVIRNDEPQPDHDIRCPMMSLPLAFGTTMETIPNETPYLHPDSARIAEWAERLSGLRGRRVGLTWHAGVRVGDAEYAALENRKSIPLQLLAPLADVEGCAFVSIQLGPAAAQIASVAPGMTIHDYTSHISSFADTAALMENLDLVISVCTSTVHLAGALGRPVWLLNRFDTDWRWFLDREDSPWYPTMRIFRQPRPGDWESVVRAAARALRAFVGP